MTPTIVLTGIQESRSFRRQFDSIEDVVQNKSANFVPTGPVERLLVFNDGVITLPCDQETFNKLVEFWKNTKADEHSEFSPPQDIPEDANVFSADDLLNPPDEQWAGEEDDTGDGVGQL